MRSFIQCYRFHYNAIIFLFLRLANATIQNNWTLVKFFCGQSMVHAWQVFPVCRFMFVSKNDFMFFNFQRWLFSRIWTLFLFYLPWGNGYWRRARSWNRSNLDPNNLKTREKQQYELLELDTTAFHGNLYTSHHFVLRPSINRINTHKIFQSTKIKPQSVYVGRVWMIYRMHLHSMRRQLKNYHGILGWYSFTKFPSIHVLLTRFVVTDFL